MDLKKAFENFEKVECEICGSEMLPFEMGFLCGFECVECENVIDLDGEVCEIC